MPLRSRYNDPTLVECEDCGWRGQVRECEHGYKGFPIRGEDVEPRDYCPKCGSSNLQHIDKEKVLV